MPTLGRCCTNRRPATATPYLHIHTSHRLIIIYYTNNKGSRENRIYIWLPGKGRKQDSGSQPGVLPDSLLAPSSTGNRRVPSPQPSSIPSPLQGLVHCNSLLVRQMLLQYEDTLVVMLGCITRTPLEDPCAAWQVPCLHALFIEPQKCWL